DVIRVHTQGMAGKGVAHGQHVTMKVHATLGLSGGAAGECNEAHIVDGGLARLELIRLAGRQLVQAVGAVVMKITYMRQLRTKADMVRIKAVLDLRRKPFIAQDRLYLCLVNDLPEFERSQQRHGGYSHQARLDSRKP